MMRTDLCDRPDQRRFTRIHWAAVVYLDQIREIYRNVQGNGSVVLIDGPEAQDEQGVPLEVDGGWKA